MEREKYFRPEFMKSIKNYQPNPFGMYNHYFKISIRNLWKNKSYSLLNILGLTAGTVSCLYILLYVQEQYSFDDHHKNAERIFRVTTDISTSEKTDRMATISTAILPFIQEDFPEVEAAARVISCLGLFGLAALTAEQRVKEIGIRKILGATTTSLVTLLSKDLWLVLIACVIITPIAGWALSRWLQDYAYRINISWWFFVFPTTAALLISLVTISFQAIKAAMANPVQSLRSE